MAGATNRTSQSLSRGLSPTTTQTAGPGTGCTHNRPQVHTLFCRTERGRTLLPLTVWLAGELRPSSGCSRELGYSGAVELTDDGSRAAGREEQQGQR
jgi:hypothetical protein